MKILNTFLLVSLISVSACFAQDWPAFRGADGTGSANPGGVLASATDAKLQTRWKKKIGSGYASVVVAGGRVVTLFTEDDKDVMASLSASDGETIWKIPVGEKFKGENGSFDGTISTPLIHDGKIYTITPRGKILCVKADDGTEVWTKNLVEDFGAKQPLYGFATSPVMAAGTLIVQSGVEDKSLMGLEPESGSVRWAVSTDSINSQTPVVSTFQDRPIVLACGGKNFIGVDPTNGKLLFETEHGGGNGAAMVPVAIGNDTYLLTLDDRFSKAFQLVAKEDGGMECQEAWQAPSIKNTYNVPALCGENVFAYSTRILTCVDPATGRAHWKSRKPGDGFLIAIDGHVIINTKKGKLVVAKASKDGFQQVDEVKLFDDLVWSLPAYADGSIFARSLGEIARVDIVAESTAATVVSSEQMPLGPGFLELVNKVNSLDDSEEKGKAIDTWLGKQASFPVIEGDIAHFIYTGPEQDVALASDVFGARQERTMTHLADTKLHYFTMRLPADQRLNYVFFANYKPVVDNRNQRTMTSSMLAGEMEFAVRLPTEPPLKMSWFGMPEWKAPSFDAGNLAAITTEHSIPSEEEGKDPIAFKVCVPPTYDADSDPYSVIYMFNGPQAVELGSFDTAVANSKTKTIAVLLEGFGPTFGAVLTEKIVPYVDQNFRTIANRENRLVAGFGFAGTDALLSVANANEIFGAANCQSALVFGAAESAIMSSAKKIEQPTKILLQWGRFDMNNPHENWDVRSGCKKIFDVYKQNESIELLGGMVNDSTDWSSWRNRYGEMFKLLTN